MFDHLKIGDVLDVSAPAGDFVLTTTESPFLLAVPARASRQSCPSSSRSTLLDRGVPPARIRYEVFGPDLWATQTAPDSGA